MARTPARHWSAASTRTEPRPAPACPRGTTTADTHGSQPRHRSPPRCGPDALRPRVTRRPKPPQLLGATRGCSTGPGRAVSDNPATGRQADPLAEIAPSPAPRRACERRRPHHGREPAGRPPERLRPRCLMAPGCASPGQWPTGSRLVAHRRTWPHRRLSAPVRAPVSASLTPELVPACASGPSGSRARDEIHRLSTTFLDPSPAGTPPSPGSAPISGGCPQVGQPGGGAGRLGGAGPGGSAGRLGGAGRGEHATPQGAFQQRGHRRHGLGAAVPVQQPRQPD